MHAIAHLRLHGHPQSRGGARPAERQKEGRASLPGQFNREVSQSGRRSAADRAGRLQCRGSQAASSRIPGFSQLDVGEQWTSPLKLRLSRQAAERIARQRPTARGPLTPRSSAASAMTTAGSFERITADPIDSTAKPADRAHNEVTMQGVFAVTKQQEYLAETKTFHLSSIKEARRRLPVQERAYENVKHVLTGQIDLLEAAHEAAAPERDASTPFGKRRKTARDPRRESSCMKIVAKEHRRASRRPRRGPGRGQQSESSRAQP